MKYFEIKLDEFIARCHDNSFGEDNYDRVRFGEMPQPRLRRRAKAFVHRMLGLEQKRLLESKAGFLDQYGNRLENIYHALNSEDKKLLVELVAYCLLGRKKVKLSRNNREYWDAIDLASTLVDKSNSLDPNFMHFLLYKCDLNTIGHQIEFYFSAGGVATDFILEQYAYKIGEQYHVVAEEGDVVLDIGACWGDTALYFASKVGERGKVYCFEFIPGNIRILDKNVSMNPNLAKRIELVPHPVSNKSGEKIYFLDNGPGSSISFAPFKEQTGFTTTISVDEFVRKHNVDRIDFIKMDIEGAEPIALEGAIETIKTHRPKLAIAIYHGIDDFVNIPNWILDLKLGYEIFLGHYTIHAEETVIFALPKGQSG